VIKFIIVDDNKDELAHIKSLLNEVVKDDKEILAFSKVGPELNDVINDTDTRKVYILDIEIGTNVSGINIAKKIRDIDWESEIIFITNHDKMFESAHRTIYEVFDFIEKFHDFDKRFKRDIKAIQKRNFDNKMFIYKSNNGIELSLYYKNILYIYRETEDRKLVIVTSSNNYMVNMNIKDIKELLNKSTIDEIDVYKKGVFICTVAGDILDISKNEVNLMYTNLPIKGIIDINILSEEICEVMNIKPGKELGDIIKYIEEKILDGSIKNDKSEIINELNKIK